MNERIQKLMSEANLFCRTDGTVTLFGETYAGQAEIQKFAQLILQAGFDAVIQDSRFHDAKGVLRAGKHVALEHFGVEK